MGFKLTQRTTTLATLGSIASAMLSSACCWIPLSLMALGFSAAGVGVFFERWRPWFIALAMASLVLGFTLFYVSKPACIDGCCTAKVTRRRRTQFAMLAMSTVLVGAFIFFPQYATRLMTPRSPASLDAMSLSNVAADWQYDFEVTGMTCEACAVALASTVSKLDGILNVTVDYDSKRAHVVARRDDVVEKVSSAAKTLGYSVNRVVDH